MNKEFLCIGGPLDGQFLSSIDLDNIEYGDEYIQYNCGIRSKSKKPHNICLIENTRNGKETVVYRVTPPPTMVWLYGPSIGTDQTEISRRPSRMS